VAVVILLVGAIVLLTRGSNGSSDAGACLTDLSKHLPEQGATFYGSDLVQARAAGYNDGDTLEKLGSSQQSTGALPDPLTVKVRFGRLVSVADFTGQTGVTPSDIRCSLSNGKVGVLNGSFNDAEVRGSALGSQDRLAASPDFLVVGLGNDTAPRNLLKEQDRSLADDNDVAAVLSSLRDQGAYSIIVQRATKKGAIRSAGIGVGGTGDKPRAMVAWRFDKAADAEAGKQEVVERVNDAFKGSTSIDATDLKVTGELVTASLDVRKAPDLQSLVQNNLTLIRPGS
jgi:hypothetical protein